MKTIRKNKSFEQKKKRPNAHHVGKQYQASDNKKSSGSMNIFLRRKMLFETNKEYRNAEFQQSVGALLATVGTIYLLVGFLYYFNVNHSATVVKVIHAFHKLFLESGEKQPFAERLSRLEKNLANSDEQKILKSIRHQMDQLLYLELTNFHALTKGNQFDIQDLESIHSHFDPKQNELIARIDDIIKEDVSRGQVIKHSH